MQTQDYFEMQRNDKCKGTTFIIVLSMGKGLICQNLGNLINIHAIYFALFNKRCSFWQTNSQTCRSLS